MLAALRPTETGGPRQLVAAECNHELSCDGSPLCLCHIERDGAPASGIALGGNGCALRGRSLACLWPAAELTACRPGSCDCAYACTRAIALADADDARVPATEIRLARCVDHVCRYAFAIDDRCYAGTPEPRHEVDCALSDAELLQASSENAVEPRSCNDARSCTSSSPPQEPDPDVASCVGEQQNGVTAP
jgi:hypothetical protein